MAIYGIGAYYDRDVSDEFIRHNVVGAGWSHDDAPEIHRFLKSLKVGDIVYLKSYPPGGGSIHVKAVGLIADDTELGAAESNDLVSMGRRVHWISTERFEVPRPAEKNNVRSNTVYEEFHPAVQAEIIRRMLQAVPT